jgi:hypothetical protein
VILGQRTRLELKVDYEEWLPDEFDDIVRMLDRWGLSRAPHEVGWAMVFDPDRRIRSVFECARGTSTSLEVHLPTLLGGILASGGDRWIFIHNHPSGDPTPSGADFLMMEQLREASNLCGLYLEDGVVVTTDPARSYSMLISGTYTPAPYGSTLGPVEEPVALINSRIDAQASLHY